MSRAKIIERRAAIYRRISDADDEKGVDRQLIDCHTIAKRNRWDVVEVFTENNVSASRYSRKIRVEFNRMMLAVTTGQINAIIIYNMDRLLRQPKELEELIDLAEKHDVAIESETGKTDLTTSEGRLVARALCAVSAMESDNTSRRVKTAARHRAVAGLPSGGSRIFGWAADQIELVPDEADALRFAVDRVLEGASLYSIVRAFDANGITTTRGKPWGDVNLKGLLLSPRLVGKREFDGSLYPAVWEAIVSDEEHAALKAVLTDPKRSRKVGRPNKSLLSGVLFCECGTPLTGNACRQRYVCQTRGGCGGTTVRMNKLGDSDGVHEIVVGAMLDRLTSRQMTRARKALVKQAATSSPDYGAEIVAIDAKLAGWSQRLVREEIDENEWQAGRTELVAQKSRCENAIREQADENNNSIDLVIGDPIVWWNTVATFEQQRALLAREIEAATVTAGRRGGRQPATGERLTITFRP